MMSAVSASRLPPIPGPVRRVVRTVRTIPEGIRSATRTERLTLYRFPVPPPDRLDEFVVEGLPLACASAHEELLGRMKAQQPKLLNDRKYEILRSRIGSMAEQCLVLSQGDEIVGYCHVAEVSSGLRSLLAWRS